MTLFFLQNLVNYANQSSLRITYHCRFRHWKTGIFLCCCANSKLLSRTFEVKRKIVFQFVYEKIVVHIIAQCPQQPNLRG